VLNVELSDDVTGARRALVLRYLGEAERFSLTEWVTLLEAFTVLGRSRAGFEKEVVTFQEFYDRYVDQAYSERFITDLLAEINVTVRAPAIQAGYARHIYQQLRNAPFSLGGTPETVCLLSYCLYWWASFARGYAFEVEIFRDLETAGIDFAAHDLQIREQRFSPCDLIVRGMTEDIKNTTYFLYVARSFP
jgi:hypothetical protein